MLPPRSAPPPHQPDAIGCCHHRRGWKASEGLLQNSTRPSPSTTLGVGKGQRAPPPPSSQSQRSLQPLQLRLLTLSLSTASPPGSGRTCSRTMRPQNLRHVRDAAVGLGEGRAPQQQTPPTPTPAWPMPSPAVCKGPAWASREGTGAKLPGKVEQRARERWYLPHPSTQAW